MYNLLRTLQVTGLFVFLFASTPFVAAEEKSLALSSFETEQANRPRHPADIQGVALFQDAAYSQTLVEAFFKALQTNPIILGSQADSKAAWEAVQKARGNYFPQAQFQYGYGGETSSPPGVPFNSAISQERTATVNQLIFDGGLTFNQVANAKSLFSQSKQTVLEKINKIALDTAEAYLTVIENRGLLVLALENVQSHAHTLQQMRRRFSQGVGTKAEISLAEARLAQAQTIEEQVEGDLRNAEIAYLKTVGNPPDRLQMPQLPPKLSYGPLLAGAVTKAYALNPTIAAAKKAVEAAERNIHAARATLYSPNVSLQLSGINDQNIGGIRGTNINYQGLVVATYTLNGGADVAALRQAIDQKESAEHALEDSYRTVEQEIRNAWTNFQIAQEQVVSLSYSVRANTAVVFAYKKEFQLGKRSLLNVLDVENDLFNARSALLRSEIAVKVNTYQILSGVGILGDYLLRC